MGGRRWPAMSGGRLAGTAGPTCEHRFRLLCAGALLGELGHRRRRRAAVVGHGLGVEAPRAIGAADQRPGHHAREADLLGGPSMLDELLRLDPPFHRVVARRRAQVLSDGGMSQPASCRSCIAMVTSSGVSPMPRIRFDLVTSPSAAASTSRLR